MIFSEDEDIFLAMYIKDTPTSLEGINKNTLVYGSKGLILKGSSAPTTSSRSTLPDYRSSFLAILRSAVPFCRRRCLSLSLLWLV